MTPEAAIDALKKLPVGSFSEALSRLSQKTEGSIYWASDFPGHHSDNKILRAALFGIASNGLKTLNPGDEMESGFTGLYNSDGPYGDWTVITSYMEIDAEVRGDNPQAEAVLAALPPEDLRPILSEAINELHRTAIINEDFGTDMEDKSIDDGQSLSAFEQMQMFVCRALKDELAPGQKRTLPFIVYLKGQEVGTLWIVNVMRHHAKTKAA